MSRRPSKSQRARRQTQNPSRPVGESCFWLESKENPVDRALFQPLCARTFVRFYVSVSFVSWSDLWYIWALAAIVFLALWSMFFGSVTLKWSGADLKSSSHEFDPSSIHGDLDVLDVDKREKMVRQMWNMYKHNKIVTLPRFWLDALGEAYQDLTSEVSSVKAQHSWRLPRCRFGRGCYTIRLHFNPILGSQVYQDE